MVSLRDAPHRTVYGYSAPGLPRHSLCALLVMTVIVTAGYGSTAEHPSIVFDKATPYEIALPEDSPVGEASIREHAIAWHPGNQCYYLIGDVIPLGSNHHPNTYETELHLWRSADLTVWAYIGLAVPKGVPGADYDGHGVASPAGMVYAHGKLYVPFSARKTAAYTQRGIGLAWSGTDPEVLPWTKSATPISDLPGEDDDPALVMLPGADTLHCYHRTTGEGGYRIVHTASDTPEEPASWPTAIDVTQRPEGVRAQELTAAIAWKGGVHLFVIEQGDAVKGIQIAHLFSKQPGVVFQQAHATRYLTGQPPRLASGGHITPVMQSGSLVAAFWTVPQAGSRYGLQGHPVIRTE